MITRRLVLRAAFGHVRRRACVDAFSSHHRNQQKKRETYGQVHLYDCLPAAALLPSVVHSAEVPSDSGFSRGPGVGLFSPCGPNTNFSRETRAAKSERNKKIPSTGFDPVSQGNFHVKALYASRVHQNGLVWGDCPVGNKYLL